MYIGTCLDIYNHLFKYVDLSIKLCIWISYKWYCTLHGTVVYTIVPNMINIIVHLCHVVKIVPNFSLFAIVIGLPLMLFDLLASVCQRFAAEGLNLQIPGPNLPKPKLA